MPAVSDRCIGTAPPNFMIFFNPPPPPPSIKTIGPYGAPLHLKMKPHTNCKTPLPPPPPLKSEGPFQEMIPRKTTRKIGNCH